MVDYRFQSSSEYKNLRSNMNKMRQVIILANSDCAPIASTGPFSCTSRTPAAWLAKGEGPSSIENDDDVAAWKLMAAAPGARLFDETAPD
jgi:hypothetical protein